jgi:hypothetical protein
MRATSREYETGAEIMTEGTLPPPPGVVRFFYEKCKYFRVAHVDGVIGGLTPTRDIFVSVYSQRVALPQTIDQKISPDGKLGAVIDKSGKDGIFREMEIGLVMSAEVANEIAEFLMQHARAAQSTVTPQRTMEKIQ